MSTNDWQHLAACRGAADAELWHPVGSSIGAQLQADDAKAVCSTCPVKEHCLRFALQQRIDHGIYGGLTESERRRIHQRKKPRAYRRTA